MTNYVEKTYEEIFEAMLEDSVENGLISRAENFTDYIANKQDISNYYVMDKAVIATMFRTVYEDITRVYESDKVEYAEGIDLDNIGQVVGVSRPGATKSRVLVTFSIPAVSEEDINIPAGFVVATTNGVQFETVDDLYIPVDNTSVEVECLSKNTGLDTRVEAETVTVIVTDNDYSLSCINLTKSTGGNPEYTDDEYRYLLMNWVKIRLKGSEEAFDYYFANKDGIDDYRLVPNWDGSGTVKVIVDPGSSSLLNEIHNELNTTVDQIDNIFTLFAPIEKYINIYASVNVDIDVINPYSDLEKSDIQSRIVSAIKVFIDGGYLSNGDWYSGLGLGEDFIPHKLAVFLDDEIPELKNITFTTPSDYILIDDDEKGISDEIVIEMM